MNDQPSKPGFVRWIHQLMMIVGLCIFSWLVMMLVHELGHVLGALITDGHIVEVVWHPLVFSYTDVHPNPSALLVVWAGPVMGVLLPALATLLTGWLYRRVCYLTEFFTGFCFLANGLYIGLGWIDRVGDTGTMYTYGTPNWVMFSFGLICVPTGLYLWHRVSRQVGLVRTKHSRIAPTHARIVFVIAMVFLIAGLIFGNPC